MIVTMVTSTHSTHPQFKVQGQDALARDVLQSWQRVSKFGPSVLALFPLVAKMCRTNCILSLLQEQLWRSLHGKQIDDACQGEMPSEGNLILHFHANHARQ